MSNGLMYAHDCVDRKIFNGKSQPISNVPGKLYTSACCEDGFVLRTKGSKEVKCVSYPPSDETKTFSDAQSVCEGESL